MEHTKENNPETEKQDEAGKIGKQFESNMKKLIAVLNGETLLPPGKIGKGDASLADALLLITKEEKDAKIKAFTDGVRALIVNKREFDKFQKEKRKEFDKAVEEKQKIFNAEATKLFALIDDIKTIEQEYLDTMKGK